MASFSKNVSGQDVVRQFNDLCITKPDPCAEAKRSSEDRRVQERTKREQPETEAQYREGRARLESSRKSGHTDVFSILAGAECPFVDDPAEGDTPPDNDDVGMDGGDYDGDDEFDFRSAVRHKNRKVPIEKETPHFPAVETPIPGDYNVGSPISDEVATSTTSPRPFGLPIRPKTDTADCTLVATTASTTTSAWSLTANQTPSPPFMAPDDLKLHGLDALMSELGLSNVDSVPDNDGESCYSLEGNDEGATQSPGPSPVPPPPLLSYIGKSMAEAQRDVEATFVRETARKRAREDGAEEENPRASKYGRGRRLAYYQRYSGATDRHGVFQEPS